MRSLCKPLIPLNAAKVRKNAHAAKLFLIFCLKPLAFMLKNNESLSFFQMKE